MEATGRIYPSFFQSIFEGEVQAKNLTCMLLNNDGVFNIEHSNISDLVPFEIDFEDYSRKELENVTMDLDEGKILLDSSNIDFGEEVTITASNAVIYDNINQKLLYHLNFDEEAKSYKGKFEIAVEDGIIRIVV